MKFIKSNIHFVTMICVAFVLTTLFLFPILANIQTSLPSREDGVFIAWTINWVSHALIAGENIFQAPLFFPYQNTLAYSDPFFSTAILNIPLALFTSNIVLMSNIHLILGTLFMFIFCFLLGRELKFSLIGTYLFAVLFTFGGFHLHYLIHLHTYLLAGIPATIYFLLKWEKNEKHFWLGLAGISFLYQALNSPMSAWFLVTSLMAFFSRWQFLKLIKKNFLIFTGFLIGTIIPVILIYRPYFLVSNEFNYVRTIRDSAHFSHSLNIFLDIQFLLVAGIALFFGQKSASTKNQKNIKQFQITQTRFFILAIIGAILMLGPVLKISGQTVKIFSLPIPLPYAPLYYLVPTFKAFRAVSRWIVVFWFGLALLTGSAATSSKVQAKYQWIILIFVTIFLALSHFSSLLPGLSTPRLYKVPVAIPPIYTVLKERPEKVVAEFPAYSWAMVPFASIENDRLMYQASHGKTLYNGVSGFTPPAREQELVDFWQNFPEKSVIERLREMRVELLIVHYQEYENDLTQTPELIKQILQANSKVELISCQTQSCLYKLK